MHDYILPSISPVLFPMYAINNILIPCNSFDPIFAQMPAPSLVVLLPGFGDVYPWHPFARRWYKRLPYPAHPKPKAAKARRREKGKGYAYA